MVDVEQEAVDSTMETDSLSDVADLTILKMSKLGSPMVGDEETRMSEVVDESSSEEGV